MPIEMLAKAVQLVHVLRQICLDRFNEQMIMIGHLAKAMHDNMVPLAYQGWHFLPGKAIGIVHVNGATPAAARSNVVESTCEIKSKWSRHAVDGT